MNRASYGNAALSFLGAASVCFQARITSGASFIDFQSGPSVVENCPETDVLCVAKGIFILWKKMNRFSSLEISLKSKNCS